MHGIYYSLSKKSSKSDSYKLRRGNMFDKGKGFFHFVFANQDDDYYTAAYVKMKFGSYMKYELINSGFRYIFFFGKDKSYWFECNDIARERLESDNPSKGFFGFLKNKGSKKNDETDNISNWKHFNINDFEVKQYLINVFELMIQNTDAVVVMPINLFVYIKEYDDLMEKLIQLKNKSKHNIFVITSSVKASENDKYFRNTEYEFGYEGTNINNNSEIFYDKKLFPELVKRLNASTKVPKLIFLYDIMNEKECFKWRIHIWNELSYDQILTAVRYTIMRHTPKSAKCIIPPESYAAIIYAWYGSESFREEYSYLDFPENKYRCLKEITEMVYRSLSTNARSIEIEKIINQMGTNNIQDFIDRIDSKSPNMIADSKQGEPAILKLLIRYKKILKGHKKCLWEKDRYQWEEKLCDVNDMIYIFSKPFFQSSENKGPLPHELFNESRNSSKNSTFFKELFDMLEEKEKWNSWDEMIAYLLYLLFKICHDEGMRMCGTQTYNERGKRNFNECLGKLKLCRDNSQKNLPVEERDIQNEIISIHREIMSSLASDS